MADKAVLETEEDIAPCMVLRMVPPLSVLQSVTPTVNASQSAERPSAIQSQHSSPTQPEWFEVVLKNLLQWTMLLVNKLFRFVEG